MTDERLRQSMPPVTAPCAAPWPARTSPHDAVRQPPRAHLLGIPRAPRGRSARGQGRARERLLLARHGATLFRGHLLRWRLETFGLYAPSLPEARPWWRVNGRMAVLLLHRRGHYARWLAEMRALHSHGPEGWWRKTGHDTARALHAYIEQANRGEDEEDGR